MAVYRIKRFSTLGRLGFGLKGAIKSGAKGAMWGGILAPGNGIAYATGNKKIAAGITGVGALVGAGIGSKLGWDSATSSYDHQEKMKNDPKYKEKFEKDQRESLLKNIKQSESEDLNYISFFDYKSWLNVKEAPKDFLEYVKFYDNIWSKKVKIWYSSMNLDSLDNYSIPEFKEFFPIPYDPKYASEWLKSSPDWLCLATFNDAGDDGWLCYNPESGQYGIDLPNNGKSLKKVLLDYLNRHLTWRDEHLSKEQKRLVAEFKNKIKSI